MQDNDGGSVMVDFAPTEVRFFWTRGTGPISVLISRITAPIRMLLTGKTDAVPSHMGIILSSPDGHHACGEAHYDTHWRYPIPFAALVAQRDAEPGRKLWVSDPLPIPTWYVPGIHRIALRRVDEWTYSKYQIWRMWLWRRMGLKVKSKPRGVVCSEAASRLVSPYYDLPGVIGVASHDYVTPWNAYDAMGSPPEFTGHTL